MQWRLLSANFAAFFAHFAVKTSCPQRPPSEREGRKNFHRKIVMKITAILPPRSDPTQEEVLRIIHVVAKLQG
jgi:hypothetical protein